MNIGDEFIELETGKYLRVVLKSPHGEFVTFEELHRPVLNVWILNTNPMRTSDILNKVKNKEWIPNTEAGRLFFARE